MKSLETLLNHKPALIVASAAIVLFIAISAGLYINNHPSEDSSPSSETENQTEQESKQSEALSELSETQLAKQSSYDDNTKEFLGILKANVWTADNESDVLTFTDNTFTSSSSSSDENVTAFIVDAIDMDGTEVSVIYTAAVEFPDKTSFIKLTSLTDESGDVSYSLTSNAFSQASAIYSPTAPSSTVEIKGLNQDVTSLINNNEAELKEQIQAYCAKNIPSTTNVTWTKTAQINWNSNDVFLYFTTDNNNVKELTVRYNRTDSTFEVEKSSLA